ncbi:hypothetical protein L208DRAFT_1332166 [Tricholoma matsutake]|nr:hypothetical protein L208DRAFT_1332169 [Tricholoma matsutake 945]KAF8220731.1 hypothetical protein L208DRAFT_1332166 [Tricholoma matsutake 945]
MTLQPCLKLLPAIVFDISSLCPSTINVSTIASNGNRVNQFPCIESVLRTEKDIHDCFVTVHDYDGCSFKVLVSCQVGEFLPINRAVGALAPNDGWRGSLMVMKCGIQASYVGLHSAQNRAMAYHAVERFMFESNFALPFAEVKMGYPTKIGF